MKKTFTACVLAIGFFLSGVQTAWAQSDSFMLVPGIPGQSIDETHRNWIEIMSITQTLEAAGRRRSSCDIQVVKGLDIAGPKLWAAAVTGQIFPEIRVEVVKPGEPAQVFYEIKLTNVLISSMSTTVGDALAESLALSAQTATLTFFQQNPDGNPGPPVSATVSCR